MICESLCVVGVVFQQILHEYLQKHQWVFPAIFTNSHLLEQKMRLMTSCTLNMFRVKTELDDKYIVYAKKENVLMK